MTSPPFSVQETDHLWIPMADGTRLAARLWRPVTDRPVPAILEYIPYRKTDMVRARDERNHPVFAAHGYACIRVDMRGSGDSDGDMPDMYAPAELDDARQVINWLANQAWCNGRVGMFGTSWGGTASLQASVDAPSPLKAVIAVCATHDRFTDDIHYMGGCVLSDTFEWGATLPAILASPPTPHVGPDWKDRWRERIENLTCPLENWLRARGRGTYWRHGSVIHQADKLRVPILAVGGWTDRYSNSVMTLLDARPDLVWGVVGPWGHHYPDHGAPGPAIGFQRLALDWWDHYLKADAPDPIAWPRLRSWLRVFDPPQNQLDRRAGHWVETDAPGQITQPIAFPLDSLPITPGPSPWPIPSAPQVGAASGDTGYFGRPGGLPLDQTQDDAQSVVFETHALDDDLVIYGAPILHLSGAANGTATQVAVRLSDVAPDGTACRISYGLRNLALDDTLDVPAQKPASTFTLSIPLHTTAYRLRRGHKMRVALSSALWPLVWSAGQNGTVSISSGRLILGCLPETLCDLHDDLPEPEAYPRQKSHDVLDAPPLERWSTSSDTASEIGWSQPRMQVFYNQTETGFSYQTRMVHKQDRSGPLREITEVEHSMSVERPDGTADIDTTLTAWSEGATIHVTLTLVATWNGTTIARRDWAFSSDPP